MNKLYKTKGLYFKIALASACIITLAMIAASFFVINVFSQAILEKELLLNQEALAKMQTYTNDKFNRAFSLSNYMHASRNIADLFSAISDNADLAYQSDTISFIDNYLLGVCISDADILDYILVSASSNTYSASSHKNRVISPSYDFFQHPAVRQLLEGSDNLSVIYDADTPYVTSAKQSVVSFMGKIFDTSQFPKNVVVGIYIMNIQTGAFENSYKGLADSLKGEFLLLNKHNTILYSSNPAYMGTPYLAPKEPDRCTTKTAGVGTSGMRIINTIPNNIMNQELYALTKLICMVLVVSIIFILLANMMLFRMYNKKIKSIAATMHGVSGGDLSVRLPVTSGDEIGQLSEAFNVMCEQVDKYINLHYYAEISRKNAEIYALQAQINPHFLFNTIESIRMKAEQSGDPDIAQMLTLLGKMFRTCINMQERFVTLEDELDYICSYLKLQSMRFENPIEVCVNVQDALLDYYIPKLILQPIVENAVLHGMRNQPNEYRGKIDISAHIQCDRLKICVADNGAGIHPRTLKQMVEKLHTGHVRNSQHIGIKNVHDRIQLLYGAEFGIHVESEPNCKTIFTLELPKITEGAQ